VCAEDVCGGSLEIGEVEGKTAGPDEGGEHGGTDLVVGQDAVFVGFAADAVACVEFFGNGLD